jgi:RHS repeat-associated protein
MRSPQLFLAASLRSCFRNFLRHITSAKTRFVALLLVGQMMMFSLPPAAAASVARVAALRARANAHANVAFLAEKSAVLSERTVALVLRTLDRLAWQSPQGFLFKPWLDSLRPPRTKSTQNQGPNRGMPPSPTNAPGVRPREPHSKAEREAKVARLELNVSGDLILTSRQQMLLSAIPLDSDGNAIHGLFVTWETSDQSVVWVNKSGMMTAGNVGKAFITASAGQKKRNFKVTVAAATSNSQASSAGVAYSVKRSTRSEQRGAVERTRLHAHRKGLVASAVPQSGRDPDSLYTANNAVGTPPGKTKPGAKVPAAATQGSENPGSSNFFFGVPIASLPGRGLDIDLSASYNSRLWNKSSNPFSGATVMSYDVDAGWPAPGFRLGYGKVSRRGFHTFDMVDADGTRHQLVDSTYVAGLPSGIYDATDGTFIRLTTNANNPPIFAAYPDGSQILYGAPDVYNSGTWYPTQIRDRNGNYFLVSYANGTGPKISSIQDTLGRYIYFKYVGNDLIAITAPGLTGQADLPMVRFYYQDISVNQAGLFQSGITVYGPATAHVIKYIYLPSSVEAANAHIGYRYDYSAYGMMYQVAQFRGMTIGTAANDYTQAGFVSGEGTQAALTTYNYQGTPVNPIPNGGLADAPTYTTRTDEWAGRVSAQPVYNFSVDQTTGVSTVTAPDGTISETHSIVDSGVWDDGLVKETIIKQGANELSHTVIDWEPGTNDNPRVRQVRTKNEAGQARATVLTYDTTTPFNNISIVSERDFTTDVNVVSTTELRRTETTYVTSAVYTNRRLIHLPSSLKVFAGGATMPSSRVDYTYDTAGANLTPRNDIIMHDPAFDPFQQLQGSCDWQCSEWGYNESGYYGCIDWQWVCNYYSPYDPSTDYRGNVTAVTTYTDAANTATAITHATGYDIAGNVVSAQVDCCQQKTFGYSNLYYYAYPTSVTSGAGPTLTTTVAYDFNTGLVASTTDENNQPMAIFYNGDSLRPAYVQRPDGSTTHFYYSDSLQGNQLTNGLHYFTNTSTQLDATRFVDSYRFFDGRGAVTQTFDNYTAANGWSAQDVEYDVMGRAYRSSNPYYSGGYGSVGINPTGLWTTRTFDNLDRVTQVTMPSGDAQSPTTATVAMSYAGIFTTLTDQAGKQRRQKTDALGRVIRLDEPDANGNLGTTDLPAQATSYEFDALDNLIHINQGAQDRYFKFDSLSRLIFERQVEQDAPHYAADSLTGNNYWSRKIVYNSQSLVQDAYDARQINTHFAYDGLNRVSQITYSDSTPAAFYWYDSQTLPAGAPVYNHGYAAGRLIAMTYGGIPATTGNYFGYDQMGRVNVQRQVTGSNTYSLSYSYNVGGLLSSETYPSNRVMNYSFDEGGRLSGVTDSLGATYDNGFQYAPQGGLSSETFGNGAVHSLAYNNALQASQIKLQQSANGAELQRFNYAYGKVDQSNGSVDTTKNNGQIGRIDGSINGVKQWDQRMIYDSLGRLSTAAEYRGDNSAQAWATHYDYDRYGNRFQYQSNSNVAYTPVQPGDIDATRNRFINSGSTATTYDPAGNILTDAKFRSMNYQYDANGRQTLSYRTDGTDGASSVYDCAGQRVQTSANGVTRTMAYDVFGQLVADYLGSSGSTLERENIYRGGQLLAVYETGASCFKSISQFVTDFYQGALHRATNSNDPPWTNTLTQAQAQGQGQLIVAAQSLGTALFTSSEYLNLNPDTPANRGQFLTDLYAAYLGRVPDGYGYQAWLNALNTGTSREEVRHGFAYSAEFQNDVGQLCVTMNGSGIKYVLSDIQGSTRAVMDNNGGSSTVVSRHDYLPFGEEIWSGTGMRSSSQGYGITDRNRQKYGLTERDDATGLDHTWWRKYESFAGRWTSPDPYRGSMTIATPQSFNRYNYTRNDPVNFVDPSGLDERWCFGYWVLINGENTGIFLRVNCWVTKDPNPSGSGGGGGGAGGRINQRPKKENPLIIEKPKKPRDPAWKSQAEKQRDYETCMNRELKDLNIELHQIMNENLDLMVGGDILALPISLNGLQGYNLLSLALWQLQLISFNKRYEPARQAAMKTCRKEAGLD